MPKPQPRKCAHCGLDGIVGKYYYPDENSLSIGSSSLICVLMEDLLKRVDLKEMGLYSKKVKSMIQFLSLLAGLFFLSMSAFAQGEGKFKVGAILPLTGPLAEYGVAAKNGLRLAQKEHPELFKNVAFLIDDSQYENKKAISIYQKFRSAGDVPLVYVWGYGPAQALAPIAENTKSALLTQSAEHSISANRNFVVRFGYYGEMASIALLEYLREKHLKRFGIVKTELAFFNSILDGMKKNLRNGETIEVVDSVDASDSDFKTVLTKLRAKNFDAVGVFLLTGQGSQFYRQSKQFGLKLETFATDMFDSIEEARKATGAMRGVAFPAPLVNADFVARYVKEFGNDVQLAWAANSYEFAVLVGRLFSESKKPLAAEDVVRKLRTADTRSAGACTYEYDGSKEGPGFNFKLTMRRIGSDRIENIP